ncbi:hypothetical protein ACLOJK_023154 [Asimina triloba]
MSPAISSRQIGGIHTSNRAIIHGRVWTAMAALKIRPKFGRSPSASDTIHGHGIHAARQQLRRHHLTSSPITQPPSSNPWQSSKSRHGTTNSNPEDENPKSR